MNGVVTWFDNVATAGGAPRTDFSFKFFASTFPVHSEWRNRSFSKPFIEFVGPIPN